jgi:hypothetical protein
MEGFLVMDSNVHPFNPIEMIKVMEQMRRIP